MRSILLALTTVATAKLPPAFPPFAHNDSEAYVCGPARKNKVPTRADLCYGIVDREIVATKCAGGSIEGFVPSGVSH